MIIFKKKNELKVYLQSLKAQKKTIGLVPTMGALHKGHLSLISQAKKINDIIVVSIFVNPTQFNNTEDLTKYPKTIENDTKLLESVSCDVLFYPSVEEIYNTNVVADSFDFDGLEHQMEGKFRDGHFNGVGTIVKTLFDIVTPHRAYFGQKDFQQLQIIKKMVKKHRINIKIKGCAIFREADGLAMSSRNIRLTKQQREAAPFIYKTLKEVRKKFGLENADEVTQWVEDQFKKQPLFKLEYFTIADEKTLETVKNKESGKKYRAFIAIFAGEIRLIDNIRLHNL
ncbi:pantoate--beta-alanine ligase [Polaribacter glomeratus]|uniref:Pantothenate synthetase n=1 Tax=Polaribacter glomeratus TaxID=102 RepID=A0A2S7WH31_9FLAO|nr:pantoate--beta-alanine ligase [Polaribacter glomeratus]PQJ76909.1 pantoate--beta-alanine ligase [Polaribacter glomeratus]TXD67245.1 pantoate--beta-alanine ligase [Polaribacter glomeratus]